MIQAAYSNNNTAYKEGCNATGCCSFIGGNPWQYFKVYHLGSSVYCALSLLYLRENANIYQLTPPNPMNLCVTSCPVKSNNLQLILGLIFGFGLLLIILVYFYQAGVVNLTLEY